MQLKYLSIGILLASTAATASSSTALLQSCFNAQNDIVKLCALDTLSQCNSACVPDITNNAQFKAYAVSQCETSSGAKLLKSIGSNCESFATSSPEEMCMQVCKSEQCANVRSKFANFKQTVSDMQSNMDQLSNGSGNFAPFDNNTLKSIGDKISHGVKQGVNKVKDWLND